MINIKDQQAKEQKLLLNIKAHIDELSNAFDRANSEWVYEDLIYRFYYHSFKVYSIQGQTREIIELLKKIAPEDCEFCDAFNDIVRKGAGNVVFSMEHNDNWTEHTQCFVEAFFHAKFFLEMVIKYGKDLSEPPKLIPSGWAAILCLYGLR